MITCQNCGGPQVGEEDQCFFCGVSLRKPQVEPVTELQGQHIAMSIQRAAARLGPNERWKLPTDQGLCGCAISVRNYRALLVYLEFRVILREVSVSGTKFEGVQCFAGGRRVVVMPDRNLLDGDIIL